MSVVLSNHHRRRHILLVAVACLCVLLGGPPYVAGADSLTIAGQTYDEPGVSGPGWAARTLLAAGSGSGEDCCFFGLYASDGLFAVDASWVDATGAIADAACESGSLTSAQFVTPMGGAFGTACVMDASGAVA